jgi:hypothetical protein
MAAIDEALIEVRAIRSDLEKSQGLPANERLAALELSVRILAWHVEALIKGVPNGRGN